jgi:hypothetical protein
MIFIGSQNGKMLSRTFMPNAHPARSRKPNSSIMIIDTHIAILNGRRKLDESSSGFDIYLEEFTDIGKCTMFKIMPISVVKINYIDGISIIVL